VTTEREPVDDSAPSVSHSLIDAAQALRLESATRGVAQAFWHEGIPVLFLQGPSLQRRLYGTPFAYPSGDIDLLVHAADARRARSLLSASRWRFHEANGVLWRVSAAATFVRDDLLVDLHWGLHAGVLPSVVFRRLCAELWRGATPGSSWALEPRAEPLLIFLLVHALGHDRERPEWWINVQRCLELPLDFEEATRIAERSHVSDSFNSLLAGGEPRTGQILDGRYGRAVASVSRLLRGSFLPEGSRRRARLLLHGNPPSDPGKAR
jgi:Uncharacterised nucleotidyltransferase